ncbi:hypothetical protein NDU88_002275 [Pleurodeles waltl]|uniref:Uncharacterized protein n=1 Tax=Pleurodeles waltl TaxID=8319 RepID=A0AAV7VCS5_PLEWA|nr:hypothetical protein NDU88_002275 [Pleurodeles waltl]
MASNRVRVGKRKVSDPELAQLLKLVLAKLGDGDSDSGDAASEVEDNGEGPSRPRRTHVALRAAFPPVKQRNKKQVAVVQQPLSSTSAVTLSEQAPVLVSAPTTVNNNPVPLAGGVDAVPAATSGVEALAVVRSVPPLQVTAVSVTLAPGSLTLAAPLEREQGKVAKLCNISSNKISSAEGAGLDTLLSRPGKLAAHVAPEIKEKIWKGEFVDIFGLIRAKRREVETKDKQTKASSSTDKKPKVEESITNWLFGFNVFKSAMLEKKPELGIAMICYANKILRAHHMYGGNAWLEYDRDFRWAKVEDPVIGWDQTKVNVWLECVNNKLPGSMKVGRDESESTCSRFRRESMCQDPELLTPGFGTPAVNVCLV